MKGKQKSNYCIDTDPFYFITVLQQVSKNLFPNDRAAVIKKKKKKKSTFNQLTEKYERYPYSLSKCFLFQKKKQRNNRKCTQ